MLKINRLRRIIKPSENHRGGRYLEALFEPAIIRDESPAVTHSRIESLRKLEAHAKGTLAKTRVKR
jgi:hypothetical protein